MKRNYSEAEQIFKEAIKIFREKKLYKRIGMVYFYLAQMHYTQIVEYEEDSFIKYKQKTKEDISPITRFIKQSLEYSKKAKNLHFSAKGYLLLGKIFNRKHRVKEAIQNLHEGILILKNSNYSKLLVELHMIMANSYFLLEKEDEAFKILKNTLKIANKNKDTSSVILLENDISRKKEAIHKAS